MKTLLSSKQSVNTLYIDYQTFKKAEQERLAAIAEQKRIAEQERLAA